jgi:hypothetical protein
MRNTVLSAGVLLAAAATTQPGAATPQCWSNGVAVPCAAPPIAGSAANQPTYYPARRQYPPEWYYDPYNAPWHQCHLCGQ